MHFWVRSKTECLILVIKYQGKLYSLHRKMGVYKSAIGVTGICLYALYALYAPQTKTRGFGTSLTNKQTQCKKYCMGDTQNEA